MKRQGPLIFPSHFYVRLGIVGHKGPLVDGNGVLVQLYHVQATPVPLLSRHLWDSFAVVVGGSGGSGDCGTAAMLATRPDLYPTRPSSLP